ncbi:MAG: hypothetical protein KAH72_00085, partial [Flavobacteriaceae bacterium]|nr:hypothetical protein [Flavobacteriaceae bacterium]
MVFTDPETLSNGGAITSGTSAFKTKLVRLGNGLLITTYGQGNGPDVYDLKGDNIRQARDIFVRSCMPTDLNAQCAHQADWSEAVNISNGAD